MMPAQLGRKSTYSRCGLLDSGCIVVGDPKAIHVSEKRETTEWPLQSPDDAVLACQFFELRDPHFPVFEDRSNLQPAAHGFNVIGERADADVGPMLNLRNLTL